MLLAPYTMMSHSTQIPSPLTRHLHSRPVCPTSQVYVSSIFSASHGHRPALAAACLAWIIAMAS